jgi:hypothetical protein
MRRLALAALVGVGLAAAGTASARPWNDPNGRVTFDTPNSWVMEARRSEGQTIVLAGDANNECYVFAVPNPNTSSASVAAAIRTAANDAQFGEPQWLGIANSVTPMFPNSSAQFVSRSVEAGDPWPIQRASFNSPERPVVGAFQLRPGMDLMAFCWSYGGPDPSAVFDNFFRSISHPNDAAWEAEAQAAAAAVATPTPQPAPE